MFVPVISVILVVYLLCSIRRLAEHERALLVRLGYLMDCVKGPGFLVVFAPIDRIVRIDLRKDPFEFIELPSSASDATRQHVMALLQAERMKLHASN